VDLNGDGNIDILSGSYSRMGSDMAGLFQVLWGTEKGTFKKAEPLKGTDGEPLILRGPKPKKIWWFTVSKDDSATDSICTRPTAVDLNGDGKLDIVSGNFSGSFGFFPGEGKGRFAPKPTMLTTGQGDKIRVASHSDPFFVDWDADGDLDLVSGSAHGGVFLCTNQGSAKEPQFTQPAELVPAFGYGDRPIRLGDAHLKGPQTDTRVWVDDINGDGKLDLLVGDAVTLNHAVGGLDEKTVLAKFADWKKKRDKELQAARGTVGKWTEAQRKKYQETSSRLEKERETFMREESTGFVWVFYQKPGAKEQGR
jgi:hypothetical protein